MKVLKSKLSLMAGCVFLTFFLAFLPKKSTAQTINIECPDGDTHTCYTDGQRTVYKGNGTTKITVIK